MLHWKQKAQWTALSWEAFIVFSFLFFVVLTSSILSCFHRSILALKYLLSPLFSHPAPPVTMVRRDRPLQRQKDQEKKERDAKGEFLHERTNKSTVRQFGDRQMYYKLEETAVTHGSFSDFPMEAKIHKRMLIEQLCNRSYAMCTFYAWRVYIYWRSPPLAQFYIYNIQIIMKL